MKSKRGRCLALVAVLALAVCAFAVAIPAGDSDADAGTATSVGISDDMTIEYVSGTSSDPATYTQSQTVVLSDDYELTGSGAKVTIQGALVIPEGTTMTISGGAQVTVDGALADVQVLGSLVIEDGAFTVASADSVSVFGDITVEEAGALIVDSDSFVVEAGAVVGSTGTFATDIMTVEDGGILSLSGKAQFKIDNAGAVVFDGVTLTAASKIALTNDDVSLTILEVTLAEGSSLSVCDGNSVNTDKVDHAHTVLLTATAGTKVSGLHLVASGAFDGTEEGDFRFLDLSGTVSAENAGAADGTLLTIAVAGPRAFVEDSLVIGKGVALGFGTDAVAAPNALTVSGVLDATDGKIETSNAGTIDVTGLLTASSDIASDKNLTVNAACFESVLGSYCYTTLAAAIAAKADSIEVLGTMTVDESVSVPADIIVSGTLGICDGAVLKVAGNAFVIGTLAVDSGKVAVDGALVLGYYGTGKGIGISATAALDAPAGAVTAKGIYVATGSTVSEDVVKGLKHTAFYADGAEIFTVYTSGSILIEDIGEADLPGAWISGWDVEEGTEVGDVEKAEAVVDHYVYAVHIFADRGFVDIFIDGIKVATVSDGKVVYVDPDEDFLHGDGFFVNTGTHVVTYTLEGGYSGDKAIMTLNGEQFTGSFTLTKDMDWRDTPYNIELSGAAPQENKDNTLYIALAVVVVLIVIIAIAVALKRRGQ